MKLQMSIQIVGLALGLVAMAAAGPSNQDYAVSAAHRLLERAARAYQVPVAFEDTLTYELQLPEGGRETKRLHYGFAARGEVFVDSGFMRATTLGKRMYITRYDALERYVVGATEGGFGETLQRLVGELAALPEPVAVAMREGRGVEAYLDALRFKLLHTLEIADVRQARGADGSPLPEIALLADNGECIVRFDPRSGFLRELALVVRPEGAPEGYEIRAEGRFDPRILEEAGELITFDPGGRQAVTALADLDSNRLPVGLPVPDFSLFSLSGDSVHLSDLRGSVVVLEFWATWCVPCWATLQHAQELADWAREGNRRVVVLAINSLETATTADERRRRVGEFWESQELDMDPLLDLDDAVFEALGSPGLPSTMVLAPDGSLARYFAGTVPNLVASLQREIGTLLGSPR